MIHIALYIACLPMVLVYKCTDMHVLLDIFNSLRLLPLSLLISLLLAQITNTVYTDTKVKITIAKMP